MKKYFYTLIICACVVLTGIFVSLKTYGQTIPGVQQWFLNIAGNFLYPVNSSVGVQIPSLANAPCLGTNSSGNLVSEGCSGSSTTISINSLITSAYTIAAGSNITVATSAPGTITISATGSGSVSTSSVQTIMFPLISNGTVAGVNATSSTISFNVKGTGTLNPFNVASSSGTSLLTVAANGSTTISSLSIAGNVQTTATGALYVNGQTGTGLNVLQNSPTLVTPILGNASATALTLSGNLYLSAISGTQCLHSINGLVSGTGSDCGASVGGSGTITTSTPLTTNSIPIVTGPSTIGNSSLSQTGGTTFINGTTPIIDGGGDYINNLIQTSGTNVIIQTSPTSTAILGNTVLGGGVTAFPTTTNITALNFLCGVGLAYGNSTSSSITTLNAPDLTQIGKQSAIGCGGGPQNIWASQFSPQFVYNGSASSPLTFQASGTGESIFYAPGTGNITSPGAGYSATGQFTASSTISGATSTGMSLNFYFGGYQSRPTNPTIQGQFLMASTTGSNIEWTVGQLAAGSNITLNTSTPGQILISAATGGSGAVANGISGFVTRYTGTSTISTGVLLDNASVAGVNATSSSVNFNIQGTGSNIPLRVTSSTGATLLTVLPNGYVGIGTSTPSKPLEIWNGDVNTILSSTNLASVVLVNTNTSTIGTYDDIGFQGLDNNGSQITAAKIAGVMTAKTPGAVSGDFVILTRNAGTLGEKLRVLRNGSVGIGTSSPNALLHVYSGSTTLSTLVAQATTSQTSAIFDVWDPNNNSLFNVLPNGSTTISSLAAVGCVNSTITGALYVSSCAAGGGVSGSGITGFSTIWNTPSTITASGDMIDNGTVSGVNATSSTSNFTVQGTGTNNSFTVSSSSTNSLFTVLANNSVQLSMNAASTFSSSTVGSSAAVLKLGSLPLVGGNGNGTVFAINESGAADFLNFENAGGSQAKITSSGAISGVTVSGGSATISNNALSNSTAGTTLSEKATMGNNAGYDITLADNSANRTIGATVVQSGILNLNGTNFNPTNGGAAFNSLQIANSFTQTSTATGTTRGLFINSSLLGVYDYRSFEIAATTTTLTSQDNISAAYNVLFNPLTYSSASSVQFTLANASTLNIAGVPNGTTASTTIASSTGITIAGNALTNVTNGFGLYVTAPTGATNNYAAWFNGNFVLNNSLFSFTQSTAPGLSCGGGCAFVGTGTDAAGRVRVGTGGVTNGTITWSGTHTTTPICTVDDEQGGGTQVTASATPTTLVFTSTGSLTAHNITYICVQTTP